MADARLSDYELDEIKTLAELFSDLDRSLIIQTYLANDRDYKSTQQALADLATNPNASQSLPLSTSGSRNLVGNARASIYASAPSKLLARSTVDSLQKSEADEVGTSGAAVTGLAAYAMQPAPSDDDNGSLLPALSVNALTDTLTQVGNTVSDSLASFATNLTGWVADLASAFDATWGLDGDEGEGRPVQVSDKNAPAVGYGGSMGIERPYQRRLAHATSGEHKAPVARIEAEAEGEENDGWDDEDFSKDD